MARLFCGAELLLSIYDPCMTERTEGARILIDALRRADGAIFASAGYHGSSPRLVDKAQRSFVLFQAARLHRLRSREPGDGRDAYCIAFNHACVASLAHLLDVTTNSKETTFSQARLACGRWNCRSAEYSGASGSLKLRVPSATDTGKRPFTRPA
jgi:hypothetical protein